MKAMNGQISPNVKSCLNGSELNFEEIARVAASQSQRLLERWLPGGTWEGHEYVVRNPTRADSKPGSFKINRDTGTWCDFATGEAGGDLIDLRAMLDKSSIYDAAKAIAQEFAISIKLTTPGVTLKAYAALKKLPVEFLRELGVQTIASPYGKGYPVVSIPYRDAHGEPVRARLRVAFEGKNKLVWDQQKEKPICLYGLDRLPDSLGILYLVEGESDCHTLWLRGFPALGIPGVTNFKPDRDDEALNGFDIVALVEPDEGGKTMLARLKKSKHAARIKVARLDGFKDVNELHCKAPDRFDAVLDEAAKTAKPLLIKKTKRIDAGDDEGKRTQADTLVEIVTAQSELFATPGEENAYAALTMDTHREVWPIKSRGFKRWLTHQYFLARGRGPNSDAINQALVTLDAMACYSGKSMQVNTRTASHNGKLYVDLCDPHWRAIEIDESGWRIVEQPPVYFTRAKGMKALPEPVRGGSIQELRPLLNLTKEQDFKLIVAWLLSALRSTGPYPLLALCGEPGAAKSTTANTLRSLVDPNVAILRSMPREERDLFISASNSSCLVFDNLSTISAEMSDALCRVATGGSFATRTLHSNDEETVFNVCRPVLLASVNEVIARSDLADRALLVSLARISETTRLEDDDFNVKLEAARPRILGALLDAMVNGVRELPHVTLDRLPRMAKFIKWTRACEVGLWEPGSIQAAFEINMTEAVDSILEADPVAVALLSFLDKLHGSWRGPCKDLLPQLNNWAPEGALRERSWPRSPQALTGRLTLAAPSLRKKGISIERHKVNGTRTIEISSC